LLNSWLRHVTARRTHRRAFATTPGRGAQARPGTAFARTDQFRHHEHFDTQAAKVFEAMGVYSPTLGIIGAVMGLMAVMQNLNDPTKLGHGIAAAFIATIYGISFANLLFLPMGNKLKSVIHGQSQVRTMVIEGIIAIAQGENPRNIESKLQGYFHH
jgi:chemotaxis protein MotA